MTKIKFHIPDFVRHMKLNLILADTLRLHPEYFYDGVTIGSVYGTFPTSMWNGGRLFCGTIDPRMIDYILSSLIQEVFHVDTLLVIRTLPKIANLKMSFAITV